MLCEIFRTGTHTDSNGKTRDWTADDLDKIVSNFSSNPDVPICVGHPKQTAPAYGWVNSLMREGEKLYCDFKQVQEEFKTAVNKGLFKTRSVAIDPITMTLKHIAFLGAQAPAIKGMEEFCFAECTQIAEFSADNNFLFEMPEQEQGKENKMAQEKTQEEIMAEFAENQKAKDAKISELQAELQKMQQEKQEKEIAEFCEKSINEGHILPVHKEKLAQILSVCSNTEMQFSEGGDDELKPAALVKEFINSIKVMEFSEVATDKKVDKSENYAQYSASQWQKAINEEYTKALAKGEQIDSVEAVRRIKNA